MKNKKQRICKDCEIEFTEKRTKKGTIDQCDECSRDDETVRAIGYNDGSLNKAQHISVYKGGDPKVIKTLTGFRMV